MIKMEFDPSAIAGIEKLAASVPAALEKALDVGVITLSHEFTQQVGKTYSRKIPTWKNGKQKWTRSGDLQRSVSFRKKTGEREFYSVGPAAKAIKNYPGGYAEKLRSLPVSKDGVARRNDYPENVKKVAMRIALRSIESEFKNRLGL